MIPVRSIAAVAALLAATAFATACAPAVPAGPHVATPRPSTCDDSLYVRLRAAEPHSLTERERTRLQQLDDLCLAELRATSTGAPPEGRSAFPGAMHGAGWLWMPAMMVFGGLMWLMMGG